MTRKHTSIDSDGYIKVHQTWEEYCRQEAEEVRELLRRGNLPRDNPDSAGHASYQRSVDRSFVTFVVVLCLVQTHITGSQWYLILAVAWGFLAFIATVLLLWLAVIVLPGFWNWLKGS